MGNQLVSLIFHDRFPEVFRVMNVVQTVEGGRVAINWPAKKHVPDLLPAKLGIEFQNIKNLSIVERYCVDVHEFGFQDMPVNAGVHFLKFFQSSFAAPGQDRFFVFRQ